jgi:CHAD domain-containing protein
MPKSKKWISGVSADDATRDAAVHSLHLRLEAVQFFLPRAATRANKDIEYVHQLRVATRRSMAALQLYSKLLPPKDAKWFAKVLRQICRAAGKARDLDVLAQSHKRDTRKGTGRFLKTLRRKRKAAQKPLVRIHRQLEKNNRLQKRIRRLLKKIDAPKSNDQFGPWAAVRLRKIVKRFFDASPVDRSDLTALHRFRIRGKELRYAMELLAPAFPRELVEDLYPIVEKLQEQVGRIQDHVVAIERVRKWEANSRNDKQARHLRSLLAENKKKLLRSRRRFDAWWKPEFEAQLRNQFESLID